MGTNKKFWVLVKTTMKIAMFITIIFAIVQAYNIYTYFQEHPQTEFEWNSFYESMPKEAQVKINMMERERTIVILALFFYAMTEVALFFEDKQNHWATWVYKKVSRIAEKADEKLEDDEL